MLLASTLITSTADAQLYSWKDAEGNVTIKNAPPPWYKEDERSRGPRVQVLRNGDEIFAAMLAAIRNATRTVDFVTFVYWSGDIAVTYRPFTNTVISLEAERGQFERRRAEPDSFVNRVLSQPILPLLGEIKGVVDEPA